jgi:heptosyltransferase-1
MKILVIKPSSLGDVIHALPFLKALKDTFPEALIDWVISRNLKGILEDNPFINELIIFNKDTWKNMKRLGKTISEVSSLKKKLQSKHYDIVVDLQGLLRSGLISFFTPATQKIGFADAREGSRYLYDKKVSVPADMHAVDKCLQVAKELGADIRKVDFPLNVNRKAKDKLNKQLGDITDYVVIVPSARWISKRWPVDSFASLIRKISIPCIISGSKGDRKIAQKIKERARPATEKRTERGPVVDLCGKTDLKELTALIAGARAVVSNDSGPMHIAAALNIPTIAIFGPTDPSKTGPYRWQTNKNFKVLKADVPCSPCRKKKCREFECMSQVKAETVYKSLKTYL